MDDNAGINWGALLDLFKAKDPRAMQVAQNLTPEEQQQFFDFQKQANTGKGELTRQDNQVALGVPPEAAVAGPLYAGAKGLMGLGTAGASGIGAALASKVPAAVRGGIGSYAGYELGNQVGDAVGAPAWLRTILGLTGAHVGGGMGAGRGGAPGAPEEAIGSDVSKARQVYSTIEPDPPSVPRSTDGPFRPTRPPSSPSMPSDTTVQGDKVGRSMGPDRGGIAPLAVSDYREHQAGGVHIDHEPASPDVPGKTPPNVSRRRTNADRIEQVTGSSRNGYADPRSQSLDYSAEETDPQVNALQTKLSQLMGSHSNNRTMVDASAVDSLEQLLNATGNQRPNPLGHGTMPAPGSAEYEAARQAYGKDFAAKAIKRRTGQ